MTLSRTISILVGLLGVSALLGVLPAYDPALSYAYVTVTLVSVLLYFVVARLVRSWDDARRISYVLMALSVLVILYYQLQFAYGGYTGMPSITVRIGELTTILPDFGLIKLHPNRAVAFFEGFMPLVLLLILTARKPIVKVVMGVCLLLLLVVTVLSASRGAFVALTVAVVLASLFAIRQRRSLLLPVIALLVFGVIVATALGLTERLLNWAPDRVVLYFNSTKVGGDYLFTGIGIGGTFALVYSHFGLLIQRLFLQDPHNQLLSTWMGHGLIGLLSLIGLMLVFPFYVLGVMRRARPPRLFFAAALGLVIVGVHSLFDLAMPTAYVLLGLTVGMGQLALKEAGDVSQSKMSKRRSIALAASPVALVLIVLVLNQPLRAAWYTNMGALDETKAILAPDLSDEERATLEDSARTQYQQALTIDPQWAGANRRLGNLEMRNYHFDEALPLLEVAYAQDPTHPAAVKGLGLAYTWVGQIDDAVSTFELMGDDAGMEDELYTWGSAYADRDMPLQNAYSWAVAVELDDSEALRVWNRVAEVYTRAGEIEQSRQWYERVLEVEPNNQMALQGLAALDAPT